ncbi:F-box/WD repeat-containing protein, partial [Acrasis kona]
MNDERDLKRRREESNEPQKKTTSDYVKLNIGGTIFATTIKTLTSQGNNFFSEMFDEMDPGADGSYFIDRDANDFSIILSKLRGYDIQESIKEMNAKRRRQLIEDINYYSMNDIFSDCFDENGILNNAFICTSDRPIISLITLKDGRLVSLNSDNIVEVWDIASCRRTRIPINYKIARAIAPLNDVRFVIVAFDNVFCVFNLLTGKMLNSLPHDLIIAAFTTLKDGRLVIGSENNTITIWDIATNQCVETSNGHTKCITAFTTLIDGRLVSSSVDNTIKIWDVASGNCVKTITCHTDTITALTTLKDGRLVSGGVDNTIMIWDVASGNCVSVLVGYKDIPISFNKNKYFISALTTLNDGRLVSSSTDNTIKIWDVATNQCVETITCDAKEEIKLTTLKDGTLASICGN